jgi:hypothetical protein
MNAHAMATPIFLDGHAVLRIDGVRRLTVRAVTGLLWITRAGSRDDTVLRPGERSELHDDDAVLIAAPKSARFVLELPHDVPHPRRVELAHEEGADGRRVLLAASNTLPWWERLVRWWRDARVARVALVATEPRPSRAHQRTDAAWRDAAEEWSPDAVRDRLHARTGWPYY